MENKNRLEKEERPRLKKAQRFSYQASFKAADRELARNRSGLK